MDRAVICLKHGLQLAHGATCERCKQQRIYRYQKLQVICLQHREIAHRGRQEINLSTLKKDRKRLVKKLEEGNLEERDSIESKESSD